MEPTSFNTLHSFFFIISSRITTFKSAVLIYSVTFNLPVQSHSVKTHTSLTSSHQPYFFATVQPGESLCALRNVTGASDAWLAAACRTQIATTSSHCCSVALSATLVVTRCWWLCTPEQSHHLRTRRSLAPTGWVFKMSRSWSLICYYHRRPLEVSIARTHPSLWLLLYNSCRCILMIRTGGLREKWHGCHSCNSIRREHVFCVCLCGVIVIIIISQVEVPPYSFLCATRSCSLCAFALMLCGIERLNFFFDDCHWCAVNVIAGEALTWSQINWRK